LKRLIHLHPFLLAIFPILFLFAYNITGASGRDLVWPLIVVTALTAILLFIFRLTTKNYLEAGIVTSFFLFFFFSYGHIRDLFFTPVAKMMPSVNFFLILIWTPLFIGGSFILIKCRRHLPMLAKFLTIFATALVILSLVNIGIGQYKTVNPKYENVSTDLELSSPSNPPDIYYIILDMYTREDTLKRCLDYDNSEFTNYLTDKGFYVATKSRSAYGWTEGSLASSLNMNFIESEELQDRVSLEAIIADSKVPRLLKSAGYHYIFVDGGAQWKNIESYADDICSCTEVVGLEFSAFEYNLCETTLLAPVIRVLSGVGGIMTFTQYGANSILYAFDMVATIPDIEGPTFTYAHIMCPHPPAHFTREGPTKRIVFGSDEGFYPEGYLDNLIFITKKVEVLVDEILSKSDTPPIIVVQGDHGVWWEGTEESLEILNAYYLPGKDNELLYETISPINTFRVIFNLYFGTDYELLEDRR